ncbi:MAG: rRNA maturation RNase YbeY [Crocinitomicaceae bacterium]|nr:rRNA maturation RNase YbeY [Crocinitomicaceae bacterium]
MVNIFYEDIEILELDPEFFVSWLVKVCKEEKKFLGDLSLIFTSDECLLKMNIEHLSHDYYTDIITFDYTENEVVSGDLFISLDRVYDNAKSLNVSRETELNRVVVHGVLHLMGYRDKSDSEAAVMRKKENHYLSHIVSRET